MAPVTGSGAGVVNAVHDLIEIANRLTRCARSYLLIARLMPAALIAAQGSGRTKRGVNQARS